MPLDVRNADHYQGSETHEPPRVSVIGLDVLPPSITLSSQLTGDGSTVLRLGHKPGRVRLGDYVKDFAGGEIAVITTSGAQYDDSGADLTAGNAVWATLVAVQHRKAASISLVVVVGSIAAVATAAKPTLAEIEAAIDGTNQSNWLICGDILFHRSGDTVITHRVTGERRPAYVQEANKTGLLLSQDDQSNQGYVPRGYYAVGVVDLAVASGATAGNNLITGLPLPAFPLGGRIGKIRYQPAAAAVGVGADAVLRPVVDGTALTGGDLTIDATSDGPVAVTGDGSYATGSPDFKPGDVLSIELESKTATFSAGSGLLLVEIFEYVG